MGGVQPQAKDSHQSRERGGEQAPAGLLTLDFRPSRLRKNTFLSFKAPVQGDLLQEPQDASAQPWELDPSSCGHHPTRSCVSRSGQTALEETFPLG